jgi:hypothetical protein
MDFITVTPIWYNSVLSKYQKSSGDITIRVDSISMVYHPDSKHKIEYYTIWFKGMGHQDTIKTFDPIVDKLLNKR